MNLRPNFQTAFAIIPPCHKTPRLVPQILISSLVGGALPTDGSSERLAACTEWVEFAGTCETRKVMGGAGNVEDNWLNLPGDSYRAVALRSFNPAVGEWAIWWLDGRDPWNLDVPVKGSFADGVGLFYADAMLRRGARSRPLHLDPLAGRYAAMGASLLKRRRGHLGDELDDGFLPPRLTSERQRAPPEPHYGTIRAPSLRHCWASDLVRRLEPHLLWHSSSLLSATAHLASCSALCRDYLESVRALVFSAGQRVGRWQTSD